MIGYGLRFGAALSLPCPTGTMALGHIMELIVDGRNDMRTGLFSKRRPSWLIVNTPDPLNSSVQWIGITAPYMGGMLLLKESDSVEYGLKSEKFYTEVTLMYLGAGTPVGKLLSNRDELQLLEDLRIVSHLLVLGVEAAHAVSDTALTTTA